MRPDSRVVEGGLVVASALALAVAYSWPLALHLGAAVPRDLGDPLLSMWALWWNAETLPLTAAWWNAPAFYPADGAIAYSDHRLGLGLVTTPLVLSGASPVLAYNVAFMLAIASCYVAVHGLVRALGGQRLAAAAAAVLFAVHPFRATHLEHLEILAVYWLPAAFWALHVWHDRRSHAALAAVSLTLTGLAYTSGYFFFFGGVAIAAWVVWFERRSTARDLAKLAAALAVPCLLVAPVLWHYREVHEAFGFRRSITEIEALSADLADLLVSPVLLAFWRLPWPVAHPERALFPGLTAVAVVAGTLWRVRRDGRAPMGRTRGALLIVGIAAALVALAAGVTGGGTWSLGPVTLSVRAPYKPLSIAAVTLMSWALTSPRVVASWRRQSPLAFYVLATVGLWTLALGPTARVAGERILYKAPYAWLMVLPGFSDSFRVPARFAMVAALTSAVAVALCLARWRERWPGPRVRGLSMAVLALAAFDGWIRPLPLHDLPEPLEIPDAVGRSDVILELPLGVYEDAAAMYRGTLHGRRVANGTSGYSPPHYLALAQAMDDGDVEALTALPAANEVVAFVARGARGERLADRLDHAPWAAPLPGTRTHRIYRLSRVTRPRPQDGAVTAVAGIQVSAAHDTAAAMLDDDAGTAWQVPQQNGDEVVVLDLGRAANVIGVDIEQGAVAPLYGRDVAVDHSLDGETWTTGWRAGTAPLVVASAIARKRSAVVAARFAPVPARFVRVRQLGVSPRPWAVAGLRVVTGS